MIVSLNWHEVAYAVRVGTQRTICSKAKGHKDNERAPENTNWTNSIEGACAEFAVAKHFKIYWPAGVNTFHAPDVHPDIQVRQTECRTNRLIVRDVDNFAHRFILAIGIAPTFKLVGWMVGEHALVPEWRDDPKGIGPAYFVPQEHLHPMEDFKI